MFQMSLRWKFLIYYLVFTLKWLVLISLIYQFLSFIQIILKAILVRLYIILLNCFCNTTPLILHTLHIHIVLYTSCKKIIKAIRERLYCYIVFVIQHWPLIIPWVTSKNMRKVTVFDWWSGRATANKRLSNLRQGRPILIFFQPSREPPLILLWNKYQLTGSRVYGTIFQRITEGQCQVVSPLWSVL